MSAGDSQPARAGHRWAHCRTWISACGDACVWAHSVFTRSRAFRWSPALMPPVESAHPDTDPDSLIAESESSATQGDRVAVTDARRGTCHGPCALRTGSTPCRVRTHHENV